ncbi:olfactory receptor 1009-like [Rana temporaria]|uniref:olfactory receptor 1009-like n=1 Tax=Rana temporaria TaxID=8407 RepID=UPI001AADD5CD|nr:olfactory receptor 1009-like [Rana temporaria]
MNDLNQTVVAEFVLIGFQSLHKLRIVLFTSLLLIYIVIFNGNVFIFSLVPAVSHLHTPMYFFLSNLSLSDVLITSDLVPNMLRILWTTRGNIAVSSCILQFYVFGSLTALQCLLLTAMSYDRYLAICQPLRYPSIMTSELCRNLIIFSWIVGFTPTFPVATCLSKLRFCHLNAIDHFFCDLAPFLDLACSDVSTVKLLAFSFSFLVTFFPFLFIVVSYTSIIRSILGIKSENGRQKAFSTCSSHLAVVSLYYGTLFILYGVPSKKRSLNVNKILSLLYTVVTPVLNPVIYSLKNQEIGRAVAKVLRRRRRTPK